jgi:hypothetical protein
MFWYSIHSSPGQTSPAAGACAVENSWLVHWAIAQLITMSAGQLTQVLVARLTPWSAAHGMHRLPTAIALLPQLMHAVRSKLGTEPAAQLTHVFVWMIWLRLHATQPPLALLI